MTCRRVFISLCLFAVFFSPSPASAKMSFPPLDAYYDRYSFNDDHANKSKAVIGFDELLNGVSVNHQYMEEYGVNIYGSPEFPFVTTQVNGLNFAYSYPNLLFFSSPTLEEPAKLMVFFTNPIPFFGFQVIGLTSSETMKIRIMLYGVNDPVEIPIAAAMVSPDGFFGIRTQDLSASITGFELVHQKTQYQMAIAIDDLTIPGDPALDGTPTVTPTHTPTSTATPTATPYSTPTLTPTQTPVPSSTPIPSPTPLPQSTSTPTQSSASALDAYYDYPAFDQDHADKAKAVIGFDDLPAGTNIISQYLEEYGLNFYGSPSFPFVTTKVNGSNLAYSLPNLLFFSSPTLEEPATLMVIFSHPLSFFGFRVIGLTPSETMKIRVTLTGVANPVEIPIAAAMVSPDGFFGVRTHDRTSSIQSFQLIHQKTQSQMAIAIDDLTVPGDPSLNGTPTATPTHSPTNTGTSTPTSTLTPTSSKTTTPTSTPTATTPLYTPTPTKAPTQPGLNTISVYDNANDGSGDLTGSTDFDAANNRNLTIAGNGTIGSAKDWHVYIRKGFGGMKYLGRTGSGLDTKLEWYPGAPNLSAEFAKGPDFNSVYSFRMIRIDDSLTSDDYLDQPGAVGYNVEGGNPVEPAFPAMPFLKNKRVVVCDDLLGVDDLGTVDMGLDIDAPSWRSLQIVWNFNADPTLINEYQVYVKVDQNDFVFLGQTGSGRIPYFWWTSKQTFKTAKPFVGGPQDNHTYQFKVILIPFTGKNQQMISGKVLFQVRDPLNPIATPTLPAAVNTPTPTPTRTFTPVITPTPTVYVPPQLGWIPFTENAVTGSGPNMIMKDETTNGLLVNFDIPGVYAREETIGGTIYHRLVLPGYGNLMDLGKPELPVVGRMVEVPYGVDFTFEIYKSKSIKLPNYSIIPAQKSPDREEEPAEVAGPFQIDAAVYSNPSAYPGKLTGAAAEDIGVIRGHRVMFLKVYPVQYNPVTKELTAYSNIEVRIKYSKAAQIERVNPRLESPVFENMLGDSLLNYKDPSRFADPTPAAQEGPECDYLIIAPTGFYDEKNPNNPLTRFAEWKRRKGYITRIVPLSQITAANDPQDIINYIQNAYQTWSTVPTYILLAGDAELVPTNYKTLHGSHTYKNADDEDVSTLIGTDLYYTTLDGTDYFPDLYIGRLPVDTLDQLDTVVNKILNYEMNPPQVADYYKNTSLACLFEDVQPTVPPEVVKSDTYEDGSFRIIEHAEPIRAFLNANGYTAERIYNRSGNAADGPLFYEDNTAVPDRLTQADDPAHGIPGFPWSGTNVNISAAINAGRFLFTFNGHGYRNGWGRPDYSGNHVNLLTNGVLQPVVMSWACQTGWFDNETDDANLATQPNDISFAEAFLRKKDGGAVAFIGSTRNSGPQNDFMILGAYKAIWPAFDPNPPGTVPIPSIVSSPLYRMGQINTFAKIFMANCFDDGGSRLKSFEMYHVFGDPEMPIRTEMPRKINLDFPEQIGAAGEQDFLITVTDADGDPVPNAMVVLMRGDSIAASKETNPAGETRFQFTNLGAGELFITATKENCLPAAGKIDITAGGAVLNRLEPESGIAGQSVFVGGQNFAANEIVDLYVGSQLVKSVQPAGTQFGQVGAGPISIEIPSPYPLGPVTITAVGRTSGRGAVNVFQVRSENAVDIYTYSQWDDTTWDLHPGQNATWNNPEIQLYDQAGTAVESNNLTVGQTYTIRAKIHNDSEFAANAAQVTFKWANFGIAQPEKEWEEISVDPVVINIPAHSIGTAEVKWTPPITGHLCIKAMLYHVEDPNEDNNEGQENCHIGPTSSPAEVKFKIWNPTDSPAAFYFELRQLAQPGYENLKPLWSSRVNHPDPQVLKPGESREISIVIDPDPAEVKSGETAEFALTGFLNGKMYGGVNFIIRKK